MKYLFLSITFSFLGGFLFAQTANKNIGCAPLDVSFSAHDSLSTYYWEFGDATSSAIQNPDHIYTMPGTFIVKLFETQGGVEIGAILITVLPAVQALFSADTRFGCAPLTVTFENNSVIPSELFDNIEYVWTFGDGNESVEENPIHEYLGGGNFTVSLKIITADSSCDDILTEQLYIEIPPLLSEPSFTADKLSVCDPTEGFTFTVDDVENSNVTYTWDFGDGTSEVGYGPISHVFADTGTYFISLTVSDGAGCSVTFNYPPSISALDGRPRLQRLFGDTLCAGANNFFFIASNGGEFLWSFGPEADVVDRQKKSPIAYIEEIGNYTVFLRAGPLGCRIDTSFNFVTTKPNAGFSVSPPYFCHIPTTITLSADDQTLSEYVWSSDPYQNDPTIQVDIGDINHDSFYVHFPGLLFYTLTVEDKYGCKNSDTTNNVIHRPDAYFIPDVSRGCAPLSVEFLNTSNSRTPIIKNTWIYGDGERMDVDSNATPVHVYEDPGEYFVRLIIENQDGCRDTSHAIKIIVGEEIELDFTLDSASICPGDSVLLSAVTMDDRIDAWHFSVNGEESSHCYTASELNHVFFTQTGFLDITLEAEYNGCISTQTKSEIIEVKGPLSMLDYMIDCEFPYQVMLDDQSEANELATWKINGTDISSVGGPYVHTFTDRGDYTIYLETSNSSTGCPNSIDSVTIFIRDIQSDFTIADKYCAGDRIIMDGGFSQGVDSACYKGYTWYLPGQRPRTVAKDTIHYIAQGNSDEPFILITEDINGCTDTLIKTAPINNINAEFSIDSDSVICLRQELNFTDKSISDTTLISWNWSFGSQDQNPEQIILPPGDTTGDRVFIRLTVTDANGCTASNSQFLKVYFPIAEISFLPDSLLCVGEEIVFNVSNYDGVGTSLLYSWDDDNGGMSSDSIFTTSFDKAGNFNVMLVATEEPSGCTLEYSTNINVEENPVSDFSLPEELKCNDQILFNNLSTVKSDSASIWIPGDGNSPINTTNLFHPYDVGEYVVTLITLTANGCTDTISKSLEIVAPQGDFSMSDSVICLGGQIDLALEDTADVTEFVWDFGDGTTTPNVNPITHVYDQGSTPRSTQVTLTLLTEGGCETSVVKSLRLDGALANFGFELDSVLCAAQFIDSSQSSSQQELFYTWVFFEAGPTSNEMNPYYVYGRPGIYDAQLIIQTQDGNSVCSDTSKPRRIIFPAIDDNIKMPNAFTPNNDNRNDYFNAVLIADNLSFENVLVNEFKIFNRWGNLVYNNFDPERGWNGQVDGREAPAEVYAYIIELTLKDGTSWSEKGNVTLLRGR